MNLFESQINNLNLSPTAKNTVIELRKVCLEGEDDNRQKQEMNAFATTFKPGVPQDNSREALAAIKNTIRQVGSEVADENFKTDAIVPAFMNRIEKVYRNQIAEKYGEKWGDALVAQAHKYCDANFIQ
ncbi:MAG: hypothetical protein J6Q22_05110 [Prevotella sp.]|nr:hypothetical protein [Prevotella sp.]